MGNCGSSLKCKQYYSDAGCLFPAPDHSAIIGSDNRTLGNDSFWNNSYDENCLPEIAVDADIAGRGVLAAFFIAALVTCASVFFAYLTDSLPMSMLSDTDEKVILIYQNSPIAKNLLPRLELLWFRFKSFLYRCIRIDPPKRRPPLTRDQRVEAFTRFILGFSDQQLATGLAIMIAALTNRCEMTYYEFNIVFCLAWFSATTHIVTLKVLQEYFFNHSVIRNWRVIAISAFLGIMVFFFVVLISSGDADPGSPLQCVINNIGKETPHVNDFLNYIYTLLFFLYLYLAHTYELFRDPYRLRKQYASFHRFVAAVRRRSFGQITAKELQVLAQDANLEHQLMVSLRVSSASRYSLHTYRRYNLSFLAYLPSILYSLTLGISQSIVKTWINEPKTTDDVRRMGFGQVVAVALLVMPVLTAAEIYNEAKEEKELETDGQSSLVGVTEEPQNPELLSQPDESQPQDTQSVEACSDGTPECNNDGDGVAEEKPTSDLSHTIREEIDSRGIPKDLSVYRCEIIIRCLTDYIETMSQRLREERPPGRSIGARCTVQSDAALRLRAKKIHIIFLLDAFIMTFGGIYFADAPSLSLASNILPLVFMGAQIIHILYTVEIQQRLMMHQLEFIKKNKSWVDELKNRISVEESDNSSTLSTPCTENDGDDDGDVGAPHAQPDSETIELDVEPPRRQDTEADVGVVLPHRTYPSERT